MIPTAPTPPRRPAAPLFAAVAASLLLLAAPGAARAQRPNLSPAMHWVGTWGASPSSPTNNAPISTHAYKGTNQYSNQTVRLIVRTSVGGGLVRIRLSNAFGTQALSISAAHIAIRDSGANIVAGTDRALTFSHNPGMSIPPGTDALSDPVALAVPALGDLAISFHLPETVTVMTVHELASQTNYVSTVSGGDVTAAVTFPTDPAAPTTDQWPILTAVEVYAPAATSAVATFGDSITDGFASTADTNRRWPNILAQRLVASGQPVGVVNQGISGNRVLNDQFGPNGLSRFERDVQIVGNVRWVTDLLGINDIGFGSSITPTQNPSAAQIIAGKRQFIDRARALGLKVYGCTLLPAGTSTTHGGAANSAKRQQVNDFIRGGAYDAVIDFDAVTKDPANPLNLNPAFDSGDGLHPNDAGYQAMGNAVPLSLFQ